MRFSWKRWLEPPELESPGQPKEASEMPAYQEEQSEYFFAHIKPDVSMREMLEMQAEQATFYRERGVGRFFIRQSEVVRAILNAGYICDPAIARQDDQYDQYYTNIPLSRGKEAVLSNGLEIVSNGLAIQLIGRELVIGTPVNREPLDAHDLHDRQAAFYRERGIDRYIIGEGAVIQGIMAAGYLCDKAIDWTRGQSMRWFYTDIPVEDKKPVVLPNGIEIWLRGTALGTTAWHNEEYEKEDRRWRQENREKNKRRRQETVARQRRPRDDQGLDF